MIVNYSIVFLSFKHHYLATVATFLYFRTRSWRTNNMTQLERRKKE